MTHTIQAAALDTIDRYNDFSKALTDFHNLSRELVCAVKTANDAAKSLTHANSNADTATCDAAIKALRETMTALNAADDKVRPTTYALDMVAAVIWNTRGNLLDALKEADNPRDAVRCYEGRLPATDHGASKGERT